MGLMNQLEVSWQELVELVDRTIWQDWCETEPALARYRSLANLKDLRGVEGDRAFGALLRLASRNGANDRLAALAAMHRLGSCLQRMAISLGDECSDVDTLLLGSAWMQIVTYPTDVPRRGHATHILRATRLSILRHLRPSRDRYGTEWERLTDPVQVRDALDVDHPGTGPACDSEEELSRLLLWALRSDVLAADEVELLLELVDVGRSTVERPATLKGTSSLSTVAVVAERYGVSGKTVIRSRDKALAALRGAALDYMAEVA
jgi:hypothetical protein